MILLMVVVLVVVLGACHEQTVGYLITENASYVPDSMLIPRTLDPQKDAIRIEYNAPWVTTKLQGYEGTEQIYFMVEKVISPDAGAEAAAAFQEKLMIRGGGVLMFPSTHEALPGHYVVSIRLTNEGYSQVVENAYTFVVSE